MHTHGTAVLNGPAETTPAGITPASARDQWLTKCTDAAAKALATCNANLLPVLPELEFYPKPDLCPDCEGTGYTWMGDEFTLCYCMADHLPAYDFPRIIKGGSVQPLFPGRRDPRSLGTRLHHVQRHRLGIQPPHPR